MYQVQILNLLREFHQSTDKKYQLNKLLTQREYRNQCFKAESQCGNSKTKLIITQFQAYEDFLDCEFQVDIMPQDNLQENKSSQKWTLTAFAFVGLLFIAGSITTVEHIKQNRQVLHENQAD